MTHDEEIEEWLSYNASHPKMWRAMRVLAEHTERMRVAERKSLFDREDGPLFGRLDMRRDAIIAICRALGVNHEEINT